MLKRLAQAYPHEQSLKKLFITAFLVGAFIGLFLIVFQPFGASEITDSTFRNFYLSGYGLITFLAAVLFHLSIRLFFPKWNEEKNWTTGKEITALLGIILLIALFNLLYTNFIYKRSFHLLQLPYWIGITLLVAVFPVTFGVLLRQVRMKKETEALASVMNSEIHSRPEEKTMPVPLNWKFVAENEKDFFETNEAVLCFIESADNYCTFYFFENGVVKKQMLRSSLKRIEEQVPHPSLYRCHRSYLVNLGKIESVQGNAQGYRLHLENTELTVPVSRNLGKELKRKLLITND